MPRKRERLTRLGKISYALILGLAIVGFWRGAWGLMDLYIFPNNYPLSLLTTFLGSILVLILTRNLVKRVI